ncbi:helix-turn-helix transcriptional regulator [Azohydromonas lata]|uniref:helix-turn-helix transcriptional regulator n=1 Tax=Azohydromonas lata TaxID=45677 RepID=UPI000835908F|nr:hypothetical protein [Azohydromonas lata]
MTEPTQKRLLDTADIAALLGVRRDHVTDRLSKRPDFPRPHVNLSQKLRRWRAEDIAAWLARVR